MEKVVKVTYTVSGCNTCPFMYHDTGHGFGGDFCSHPAQTNPVFNAGGHGGFPIGCPMESCETYESYDKYNLLRRE